MEQQLDEKGFVYIAKNLKPVWIRMWGDEAWAFYWHPDNKWVSLKQVNQSQVFAAYPSRLPDEQANAYHKLAGVLEDAATA